MASIIAQTVTYTHSVSHPKYLSLSLEHTKNANIIFRVIPSGMWINLYYNVCVCCNYRNRVLYKLCMHRIRSFSLLRTLRTLSMTHNLQAFSAMSKYVYFIVLFPNIEWTICLWSRTFSMHDTMFMINMPMFRSLVSVCFCSSSRSPSLILLKQFL